MHFSLPLSRAVQRVIAFYPENLRPIITLEARERQAATVYAKAAAERVREESLPLCVPAVRSHAHLITTGKQLEREREAGRTVWLGCQSPATVPLLQSPAVSSLPPPASVQSRMEQRNSNQVEDGAVSRSGETAARASFSLSLSISAADWVRLQEEGRRSSGSSLRVDSRRSAAGGGECETEGCAGGKLRESETGSARDQESLITIP